VVFSFIANPNNNHIWQRACTLSALAQGSSPYEGATYVSVISLFGRKVCVDGTVSEWTPPSRFAYRARCGSIQCYTAYDLATECNETLVRVRLSIDPGRRLGLLPEGLLRRSIERHIAADLHRAATLLTVPTTHTAATATTPHVHRSQTR
jgi:hypothetical protein